MIKKLFHFILGYFFLFFLKFNIKINFFDNLKDLNFKQNDFINYKLIKHYIFKENFIKNKLISDIHSFNFLFYFQRLGGKKGIEFSKKNIFLWYKKYKYYRTYPWTGDLISKRFLNIIYNYDFISSISSEKEIKYLNQIIYFHKKRLIFELKRKKNEDILSTEIVGYVLIKCLDNEFENFNFEKVKGIINSQIDNISMHKSYNILEHAKFLNNLNEIKNILLFFKNKNADRFNNLILSMTSILSSYRHDDFTLPLFNGCNNNHNESIQNILNKEQFVKTKPFKHFINGIALYKDINKTIFFDVIQPTKLGFNKELSAGSLSLEISALGEKIITNCGGSESSGKNPAYLKYSAAHSTIVINNTNISEIKEGEPNKTFPKNMEFEIKEEDELTTLCGTHNGYIKNYQKICKREIYINKKSNLIRGRDTIISAKSNFEKIGYDIRFHLMPGISTTVTKNKKNIIIKTKKNKMWIFKASGELSIEKSIFVENDIAKETAQIVMSGITSALKNRFVWSLEKI